MILVDSSAWIHCFRPEGNVLIRERVQTALETGEAVWCDMVKLELWNGARGDREKRVLRELESAVPLVSCTQEVWEEAYRIARAVREKGQTVPATDLLIFACARFHHATILHTDRHLDWLAQHIKA